MVRDRYWYRDEFVMIGLLDLLILCLVACVIGEWIHMHLSWTDKDDMY